MATTFELEPVIYGRLRALRKAESRLESQFETLHSASSKTRAGFLSSLAELKMQAARLERFLEVMDHGQ